MPLTLKRAYDPATEQDGYRVLVDRIWPRGVAKAELCLDAWAKDLAPSPSLRRWFAHDPQRWDAFKRRYFAELDAAADTTLDELRRRARDGTVTLVFGAKDAAHSNAAALREYLERG